MVAPAPAFSAALRNAGEDILLWWPPAPAFSAALRNAGETSCNGGPRPLHSSLRSETRWRHLAMVAPDPCVLRCASKRRGDFLLRWPPAPAFSAALRNAGETSCNGGPRPLRSPLRFETPGRLLATVAPTPAFFAALRNAWETSCSI